MKIYFTAAISLNELYGKNYAKIIETLKKLGHTVIHEQITDNSIDVVFNKTHEQNVTYYKKTIKEISKADLLVAEVSFPSTLNVGHEVSLALEKGKPVIALYVQDKNSPFFEGINSENFYYQKYDPTDISKTLPQVIDEIIKHSDTRFNFYISPEIGQYLDWVSQHKKLPRAVFLRSLLEKSMKSEKDFEN
jgi:transposase